MVTFMKLAVMIVTESMLDRLRSPLMFATQLTRKKDRLLPSKQNHVNITTGQRNYNLLYFYCTRPPRTPCSNTPNHLSRASLKKMIHPLVDPAWLDSFVCHYTSCAYFVQVNNAKNEYRVLISSEKFIPTVFSVLKVIVHRIKRMAKGKKAEKRKQKVISGIRRKMKRLEEKLREYDSSSESESSPYADSNSSSSGTTSDKSARMGEIKTILGEDPTEEKIYGPEISSELANRWKNYLQNGIDKETKAKLFENSLVPSNCSLLEAPKNNPEVQTVISASENKKDSFLAELQNQLGKSISVLGTALSRMLEAKHSAEAPDPKITNMVEAGKMLCAQKVQKVASMQLRDSTLFGEDFGEKCKSAKNIETAAKELKPQTSKNLKTYASKDRWKTQQNREGRRAVKSSKAMTFKRRNEVTSNTKLAGRIRLFFEEWEKITTNGKILGWVKGYRIPFNATPVQKRPKKPPNLSGKLEKSYSDSITKLIDMGAVKEVTKCNRQFLSSYFLRKKPDGNDRFILNLKKLNTFITPPHLKLEDNRTAKNLISQDCYLASVDLKDAYFSIPVATEQRKYLRFQFKNKILEFQCLPFGLGTAPYAFTKILKPAIEHLRAKGLSSVIYLDDTLLIGKSKTECRDNINQTCSLLQRLGFVVNKEKSCLSPKREIKFLGFIFNTQKMTMRPTTDKISKITAMVKAILKKRKIKIRDFSKFVCHLVSICPATQYGWLHTKQFEREKYLALKVSGGDYDKIMKISPKLKSEFLWWLNNIKDCENSIAIPKYTHTLFTDASNSGWGAFYNGQNANGFWDSYEKQRHINYLELKAKFFGLKTFFKDLRNSQILLRIDNTTAVSYINRMGGVKYKYLNDLTKDIWQWCEERNIKIFASYINSESNVLADKASRSKEIDTEYSLNVEAYKQIVEKLGCPEIDLFASYLNKKCKKFVSWYPDPESQNVDAFTLSWENIKGYIFPPFALLPKVLSKIEADRAKCIKASPTVAPTYPGSRGFIREAFKMKNISGNAADLMLKSLSENTIKQYNTTYSKWWEFFEGNKQKIFQPIVHNILEFLSQQFQNGSSYSSINTHKSAINLISEAGKSDTVERFMKGVFKTCPSFPRYDETWDPSPVLIMLEKLYPLHTLDMSQLSVKLVVLLALTTAQRVQTFSEIKISNIVSSDTGIQIKITDIVKTSGPKKPQPLLKFSFFRDNPALCVCSTILHYIERTKSIRGSEDYLILTAKRPYHCATTQTLSRWIKNGLKMGGVDTKKFKGHSTRHAASSAALRSGIKNVDIIEANLPETKCNLNLVDDDLQKRKLANFSSAVDESTDTVDTDQLAVCIRGINSNFEISSELLKSVPFTGTSTANDIYFASEDLIAEYKLDWNILSSTTTDGVTAMTGKHSGVMNSSEAALQECVANDNHKNQQQYMTFLKGQQNQRTFSPIII
ncbi:uncharacterized protein LOC130446918 [Diorhabda sublineata]|uniref:uncharacterized protein LOC130446918 n=1 Tax=Diorhabda sublineata TaxID=1163346 RepID=UPI0024E07A0C|nr:uncharacterized protein LOC130446918 [Diorhabda sublineata]